MRNEGQNHLNIEFNGIKMKKITVLILGTLLIVSCGKSKETKMLYEYQQAYFGVLNADDLDLKVQSMEKIGDIKASDSMKVLKRELGEYWAKDTDQSITDTLSFKYVKDLLNETIVDKDTMSRLYQKAMISGMEIKNPAYEREAERKRDEAIDEKVFYQETLLNVESLESKFNSLAKNPNSILSSKYRATYTLNNPRLENKIQTYNKVFYTDGFHTKFVKEEILVAE